VTQTLAKAGKTLTIEDEALEVVVVKGYSIAFGARFLKRIIDEHIKLPISAQWKNGSHFDVRARDGELVVEAGIAKVSSAIAFGDVA
jgi:ATP-dependent Clp protease ATP-binding subunit ClpA